MQTLCQITYNLSKIRKKYLSRSSVSVKLQVFILTLRSSRSDVFCKKGVLRSFSKFKGKHLCQRLFLNKVRGLGSGTGVFLWILQNVSGHLFFNRTPPMIASKPSTLVFIEIYGDFTDLLKILFSRDTSQWLLPNWEFFFSCIYMEVLASMQ